MRAESREEGLNQPAGQDAQESQHEAVPPDAPPRRKPPNARKSKPIPARTPEAIAKAVPETAMKGLKAKQQLFVREYLVDLNATQAAIRAGYSPNSASEIGYENLRKPQIAAAIDSAFMELGGITRSRIVDELGAIAFANIGQVLTWGDEIQEISEGDTYFINGEEHLAKEGITRLIRQGGASATERCHGHDQPGDRLGIANRQG